MKKNAFYTIALLLGVVVILGACQPVTPTLPISDSQTQVAIFAQATLTKAAVLTEAAAGATPTGIDPNQPITSQVPATDQAATATQAPADTATSVPPTTAPTPTVPMVQITPIVQPTSAPATAVPTAPSGSTRLSFAAGTTNSYVEGSLAVGATTRYVFWMDKYQMMDISTSGANAAYIQIKTPGGKTLVDFSQGWTWYRDYAQEAGDYVLDISGGKYAVNYGLYLSIPQRLSFKPGESSLTVSATVPASRTHNFIAWANKGQTMKVIVSPGNTFGLSIWHVDGTVILSGHSESSSAEVVLPLAGDYIINVISPGGSALKFDLALTIN